MPDFILDESFDRAYDIEFFDDYPNTPFPVHQVSGIGDGVHRPVVRVTPRIGAAWFGILPAPRNLRLYTCPDENEFLVGATIVRAADPFLTHEVTYRDEVILPIPEIDAIVIADFCDVYAWGRDGRAWTAFRVAGDGIRNLRFFNGLIYGQEWRPNTQLWHSFALDPRDAPNVRPIRLDLPPVP